MNILGPLKRRPAPLLELRRELRALAYRADAKPISVDLAGLGRVHRGAAFRAEGMHAFCAALGGLDVGLRLAAAEADPVLRHRDVHPERRARAALSVSPAKAA